MQIKIIGKQVTIRDELREHIEKNLTETVTKFFANPVKSNVSITKEAQQSVKIDITVHPTKGIMVQGSSSGTDAQSVFDTAADRIGKQLKRYKKRLTDHKGKSEAVNMAVIAPEYKEEEELPEEEQAPMIVAEMEAELPLCTVSGAVMRMDLADAPAVMFRNVAHGGLNMIYRRPDGNIGWVDPQGS